MATETDFTPSEFIEPTRQGAEIADLEAAAPTSLAGLGAALQAADSGYYTDERLNRMTKNDMRFAHRTQVLGLAP
jgi:hypothetical protein